MKFDPNSREELPAVLRVAAQLMAGLYVQANGTAHSLAGTAMLGAHTLIAAYNDGQDDEPSNAERVLKEIASIVSDRDEDVFDAVCDLKRKADELSATMPTALDRRGWYVKDLEDTLATIAKAVGLDGEPDADALIAKVKELAKPMPTREEMVERAMSFGVYGRRDSPMLGSEVRALIDYILDGEAR